MGKTALIFMAIIVILVSSVFVRAEADLNQTFNLNLNYDSRSYTYITEESVYIDEGVIKSFLSDNLNAIEVGIQLKDNSNLSYENAPEENKLEIYQEKKAYFKSLSTQILNNLNSEEFNLTASSARQLFGYLTKKGLEKLGKDPRVSFISTPAAAGGYPPQLILTVSVFIDPSVLVELEKSEWAYARVIVKDTSVIDYVDLAKGRDERRILIGEIKENAKKTREMIIGNLSADEFNVTRLSLGGFNFEGYIIKKGLDKLNNSPYTKSIVIPLQVESANYTKNQTIPYLDPEVLNAFEQNQTWVDVFVILLDNSNITIQGTKEERRDLLSQRDEILNRQLDNFLSTYSDDEIQPSYKRSGTFTGGITKEGFDKLVRDPKVKEIRLEYKGMGSAAVSKNNSMEENKTSPYVDQEIYERFANNWTWVTVGVKYIGDIPVTFENEEEMVIYYFNSSIAKSFFGYIPETEMRNIQGGLSALKPFFTAEVTKEGIDELIKNSRVTKIGLNREVTAFGNESPSEKNIVQNQTEIKNQISTKPQSFFQRIINFFRSLFRWK